MDRKGESSVIADPGSARSREIPLPRTPRARRKRNRGGESDTHSCIRGTGNRSWRHHRRQGHGQGAFDQSRLRPTSRSLISPVRRHWTADDPGHERGSSVVEVVIIIPAFMLLLLLAVQAALWAVAGEVVQGAAAAGSETAAGAGSSIQAGRSAAMSYLSANGGSLLVDPSVDVTTSDNDVAIVHVRASAVAIIPLLNLGVSAVRVEPIQEFRESG
jgi:TadE-like protein